MENTHQKKSIARYVTRPKRKSLNSHFSTQECSKMSASELIDALSQRVDDLECLVGDTTGINDEDLTVKVRFVTGELNRLFREGHEYSENLLHLLETFAANYHGEGDQDTERLQTIISCYDDMQRALKDLQKLDIVYTDLFRFAHVISNDGSNSAEVNRLNELPQLMARCNDLLVNSLWLARKFMSWNIRCNEFFNDVKIRLNKLENSAEINELTFQ